MRSGGGNGGASATEGVADSGAGGGMDVGRVGMALAGMVGAGFGRLAVVGMASHREYLLERVVAASDGRAWEPHPWPLAVHDEGCVWQAARPARRFRATDGRPPDASDDAPDASDAGEEHERQR